MLRSRGLDIAAEAVRSIRVTRATSPKPAGPQVDNAEGHF